ncbi:hypothetical protein [Yeosuana marina]|uniref:hypothetical protein n=1 Tax=Yeosuana marina TaxID=1565536 RepID=UPI00142407BA|nr:hypothetical protein [Yeosuana marina]
MTIRITLIFVVLVSMTKCLNAQTIKETDSIYKKYFIGSTFFMLGNFAEKNKPDFVQLNFGYRITPKDVVSIELITWKYAWSLGIPYGDTLEAPEEEFPGYIREYGIAFAYQRFFYKGFYGAIHVMNARQTFVDENGDKIKNGYQMFNTYRLGYQFRFFKNKFFIEPSIGMTHRPIRTKMPSGFAELDDKWPRYFIGEPGLHFGFNF